MFRILPVLHLLTHCNVFIIVSPNCIARTVYRRITACRIKVSAHEFLVLCAAFSFGLTGNIIYSMLNVAPVISGSPSARHGASSGCGWRNGIQIWRVAANIFNKQSRIVDGGSPPGWGLGELLRTPRRKNVTMLRNGYTSLGFGLNLRYNLSSCSGWGQVAGCCERGNEPSGSINCGEFLE